MVSPIANATASDVVVFILHYAFVFVFVSQGGILQNFDGGRAVANAGRADRRHGAREDFRKSRRVGWRFMVVLEGMKEALNRFRVGG